MSDIWDDIPLGSIVDEDLIRLAGAKQLIIEEFEEDCVRQACYELRAGDIFYEVQSPAEDKRVVIPQDGGYILRPHCYAVSIVKEKLCLPSNVMGRILAKGRLFSIGILPINTYADPGFQGRLGIILYNASHRYILIKPGERIAKIEFSRLSKSVTRAYSGQHGYESQIWPIASQLYVEPNDSRVQSQIGSSHQELELSYGPRVAEISRQLRSFRYGIWIQLAIYFLGFGYIFANYNQMSLFQSVAVGVLSTFLSTALLNFISDSFKWFRARK